MRHTWSQSRWLLLPVLVAVFLGTVLLGCQSLLKSLSNHLSSWDMLKPEAMEDPLQAVGGKGAVFTPPGDDHPLGKEQLCRATPQQLVAYYAPIFVQQHPDAKTQRYPYPAEYDDIGEAQLVRDGAKYKAVVAGQPKVYAIYQKRPIEGHDHIQLTYTAWYPAHPRMKMIDLEEADIDSCVVRVTLDANNTPLFFETIAACGCFHKVFVDKRLEDAAVKSFQTPEKGKKFCIQKTIDEGIDWEVAGVVDEPADKPRRPVVFLKAGDHKVIGMSCAAHLRAPGKDVVHSYALTDYADLYSVQVKDSQERKPFFDMGKGGKVWGAERKESFIFKFAGVDHAGQPRANDQIKLHFDQSTWDDVTTYKKYLRLPDGAL